jgi:hypothetical protein
VAALGLFGEDDRGYLYPLAHAVEGEHRAVEHPDGVVHLHALVVVRAEHGLEPARGLVGEVADRAAGQRGEARAPGQFAVPEILAREVGRADSLEHLPLPIALHERVVAAPAHDHLRVRAEEGVARDALAALDGFEQEGVGRSGGHAQESPDRRLQVREHAPHHGHDVAAPRLAQEIVKG